MKGSKSTDKNSAIPTILDLEVSAMISLHARHLIAAAMLPLALFTAGCDAGADTLIGDELEDNMATEFTITSTQIAESSTLLKGTFEAVGSIQDEGDVRDVLDSPAPPHLRSSISGMKTLSSEKGTIEIKFYAGLTASDPNTYRAQGGFSILSGSGAYEGIEGSGKIDMEVAADESPDEIAKVLTGNAWYVR